MAEAPISAAIEIYLTVNNGLEAIEFYKQAFGAQVVYQELTDDKQKVMHASLTAFGAHFMLSDHFPQYITDVAPREANAQGSVAMQINMQTPQEVDAAIARAQAAGATVTMPATDTFWVMRYGRLKDPYGYVWAFGAPLPL
jgi:PhnB protein